MVGVTFFISLFIPLNVLAMFCPTNFNSIDLGNSIAQVQQFCGQADSSRQYQMSSMTSQEWTYYIKPKFGDTRHTKMRILFKNDKVINVNTTTHDAVGVGCSPVIQLGTTQKIVRCSKSFDQEYNVSATTLCGPFIQLGDSTQTVASACGQPDLVSQPPSSALPIDVVEMRYDTHPPVTLVFENGLLTDRKFN